ncbi:hypothetical protein AKJ09_04786 [Labilithrix luteola]|uniref:Uncharacterized protein n=1 Tax=Labilithrix luteola TaxID=1391654 RepID=A0A0K1PX76_9BACT|nr:hypothetical protein AKJ09_04786 [Labilithrix luteola]
MSGELTLPTYARGLVVFACTGLASRRRPSLKTTVERIRRNVEVATLVVDLLTPDEDEPGPQTPHPFGDHEARHAGPNVTALAQRLYAATDWVLTEPNASHLRIGYYASGVAAAAALVTASTRPDVRAIVSTAGRADLAGQALEAVLVPTLFIASEADDIALASNRSARGRLRGKSELALLGGAGANANLESGQVLEELTSVASEWFARHLA